MGKNMPKESLTKDRNSRRNINGENGSSNDKIVDDENDNEKNKKKKI